MQAQAIQPNRLVGGGTADATLANGRAGARRQHHVDQLDLAQLVEHFAWLIAQTSALAPLGQCLPQHVGQKADEDVCLDAMFFLVPDGTNLQVGLVNAKSCFRFGQLHVRLPQILGAPVGDVGAQQITAFT